MTLKWISLFLVIVGVFVLLISLVPTKQICRDHSRQPQAFGWNILFVLICMFIVGYAAYAATLLKLQGSVVEFVVALILFGGSLFVMLVARLSLLSIQEVKRIAALERYHALHDELTNLPNRTLLYERMNQLIISAKRNQTPMIVMIMDLNQFKEVNDTLGHHCGDQLLQQVAPRIKSALRESDTVARLGGDEFAFILPDTDIEGAKTICEKMIQAMDKPFTVEGHSLKIGASIGFAKYPDDARDSDTLLQKADVAMYVAKHDSSGYAIYDVDRDLHSLNRLMIIGQLHEAIRKNEFEIHYQPVINVKTGRIWGVEALVRWNHKMLGLLGPGEFIPIAEQSSIINELTLWVINRSIEQFSSVQQYDKNMRLSINISVKDIQDSSFVENISSILVKHNFDAGKLHIEITESSMMTDSKQAHSVIAELHKSGVNMSIDDFGTGFSSLSYLKQLPAKILKIDKTFVIDMIDDDNDAVIVRSTIDLAHNMGRLVIAEGVENKETLEILEILGCDYAQGFYICMPLTIDKLAKWVSLKNKIPLVVN
ncbi:MAG: bifunctional diguanylate cyclase/phosphodiesterase [Gammaproteobacteria bacterium]|nr:bifunctional diguanylate cyclase/phosphodiesterase [Gammaproteobacteria bacterium]